VERKRLWITAICAEWRDLNSTRVVREWVNGEGFLYLGSSHRLSFVQEQHEPLTLKEGRFCLVRELVETGGEAAAKLAFEGFYSEKGLQRIRKRVDYFAPKVGVNPTLVDVKDLDTDGRPVCLMAD
jgi:predicted metal-dependent hydrolase